MRGGRPVAFGLFLCAAVAAAPPADPPREPAPPVMVFDLDAQPKEIADALRDLKNPDADRRKAAAAALAKLAEAEPYLRHYRATEQGKADGFAGDALDALERGRAERIMKRAASWAKAGRLDLLVDASLLLT